MKFGVLTDVHYGFSGVDDDEVLSTLSDTVAALEREVDAVLVLGDVIHEGGDDEANLERVVETVTAASVDCYVTPGNHDANGVPRETFADIVPNDLNTYLPEADLAVVDSAFGLDPEKVGYLGDEAVSLVESEDPSAVATHYPLRYTSCYRDSPWFAESPETVFPVDKRRLPDLTGVSVMSGHLHLGYRNGNVEIFEPFTQFTRDDADDAFVTGEYSVVELGGRERGGR